MPPSFAAEISEDSENYSTRPEILTIEPKSHPELREDWAKVKRGYIEATAMLLELYPDREIYFLARDTELLYDLSKFATRAEPQMHSRVHLLNVSRFNMRDEHLRDYLAQEGISESALKLGKKVLFVDTGFFGNIPRIIFELFPKKLRANLQTQMMCSTNPLHPSSRVFLTALGGSACRGVSKANRSTLCTGT